MMMLMMLFMVAATGTCLVLGLKANKQEQVVQERFSTLAKTGEVKKTGTTRSRQMEASFNERVLFPFAQRVFDKTQQMIPLSSKSWVKSKLVQAGYQKPHYPKIFLGIQLLTSAILFGSLFSLTALTGFKLGGFMGGLIFAGFFGLMGYGLPMLWLIQQAGKRQQSIQKSLADFLDLLVICVEAGLGLDTAISKIANMKSVKTSDYLKEELLTYCKDVGFGKPRKQALLDFAERTGVDDLNAIINAIVQSYEMGTGVAHTLRIQSDSLRVKRLAKAEEKANKIPVKMVMPIYMFLFPSIFVSIFGPMGMVIIEALANIMGNLSGKLGGG